MLATGARFAKENFLSCLECRHLYNPLNLQSIRWRRKPRWLPVAQSKLFRIPVKNKIPPEELLELMTIKNHYKTEMKSLRSYFAQKSKELLSGEDVLLEHKKNKKEELQKCLLLNEAWNKNVALMREERIAKEKEAELEKIIKIVEENKLKAKERKEKLEAVVRKEKELSKFYITPSNIDEAIEKAMSNELDYNFSIDLDGNIFRGRNAKPTSVNIKTKMIEEPTLQS